MNSSDLKPYFDKLERNNMIVRMLFSLSIGWLGWGAWLGPTDGWSLLCLGIGCMGFAFVGIFDNDRREMLYQLALVQETLGKLHSES